MVTDIDRLLSALDAGNETTTQLAARILPHNCSLTATLLRQTAEAARAAPAEQRAALADASASFSRACDDATLAVRRGDAAGLRDIRRELVSAFRLSR
jgi:hypothetical protein